MNVQGDKLIYFQDTGEMVPTLTYLEARRGLDEAMAMYSSSIGIARWAFESAIGSPGATLYGTLDLPGAHGDSRYGMFRLVCDAASATSVSVVLAHNTATAYFHSGSLDESAVCADTASWGDRADLAACRLGNQAEIRPEAEWPQLLTEEDSTTFPFDLVEVVSPGGRRPFADVDVVRIAKADYDSLADEYGRALVRGLEPDATAVAVVDAFAKMVTLAGGDQITLEVIQ